ncbi:molybdopterin cofactor-binding domain-containing protein, partial [Bordetella pertussis]|uniref:molybdopterin cofactor-binding domain-containing protein n=1 Tax=Bordetella pertussis TaxID=520 RepID=UPI000708AC0E
MRIAIQNLSRRRFVQGAGGLLLGLSLPPLARRAMAAGPQAGDGFAANAFVRIGADGRVTVLAKHLEMGQGAYTGLATLLAEELDADWRQVRVEGAPADSARHSAHDRGGRGRAQPPGLGTPRRLRRAGRGRR